ncbi:hypothetical protein IB221_04780 [Pantoea sp. PNT01]|uniref:hypothetical protein n=1 Tax=Pantoea sp. PNT01 TaxID=2769271 RepID=UPI00177CA971|nr:hypothetical protein [Pantoea sp. PNT01]MBD9551579.1 hypothetical protein [Pantoea sp. PNT01]
MSDYLKIATITASMKYPIISAYEFAILRKEKNVRDYIDPCTIYIIGQRPLLLIENFREADGVIEFNITDKTGKPPLICKIDIKENKLKKPGKKLKIKSLFYKKQIEESYPFNDLAGFQIYSGVKFLAWFSPQKFIYEHMNQSIKSEITGRIEDYIDYNVHYIGKSFSQKIWDRLTGHHKLQDILTFEDPLNNERLKAPFEISIMLLHINSIETTITLDSGDIFKKDKNTILHNIDNYTNKEILEFFGQSGHKDPKKPERLNKNHTNEVEAMLINHLKPTYNEVKFDNYPFIKNGMRDLGFSDTQLIITNACANLRTDTTSLGKFISKTDNQSE